MLKSEEDRVIESSNHSDLPLIPHPPPSSLPSFHSLYSTNSTLFPSTLIPQLPSTHSTPLTPLSLPSHSCPSTPFLPLPSLSPCPSPFPLSLPFLSLPSYFLPSLAIFFSVISTFCFTPKHLCGFSEADHNSVILAIPFLTKTALQC